MRLLRTLEKAHDQMTKNDENWPRLPLIGVGMTKFDKPGTKEGDYPDWRPRPAATPCPTRISYDDVEQAYAGYCYGDSTYGQRAVYQLD